MVFTAAVEGPSDEVALRKIVESLDAELAQVYGRNGKSNILKNISGYNSAARFSPWIVLIDLDREICAPEARMAWLPNPANFMCFRVAVRELEAWLLADRERFASFFSVNINLLPIDPDALPDPKLTLINIVRRSRRSAIRADIVPSQELGQTVGPAYTARIIEFITSVNGWRVDMAAGNSPSLRKAIRAIEELRNRIDG